MNKFYLSAAVIAASLALPALPASAQSSEIVIGITVTTTGGVFDFRPEAGTVSLGQRIGAQREVATLRLGTLALDGLRVLEQGAEAVRLRSRRGLRVTVTCDSVLRIESRRDALTMAVARQDEAPFAHLMDVSGPPQEAHAMPCQC